MSWLLILPPLLFSLQASALTEQEVTKSVLTHFPLILEAERKAESAKGERTAAEGEFDSKLVFKSKNRIEETFDYGYFEAGIEKQTTFGGTSLIAGHRRGLGRYPAYDGKMKTSGAGEIFAGLSVPLLRNFKTDEFRTNLKLKEIEQKQADLEVHLKKMVYLHKSLSLYYRWILETQKLKINRGLVELALKRQSMIERKFKAGDLEKIKVMDNQRAIDKRNGEIVKSEIELNKTKTELAVYLRDDLGQPMILPEEPSPNNILQKNEPSLPLNTITQNPQLKMVELEREKLKAEAAYYDQSRLPGLNLEVMGSKDIAPRERYNDDRLEVGLKFDFPLENRKADGKRVSYKNKVMAIDHQKRYLENELSQQLNFFIKASSDSKARWEITTKEFESTKTIADAEKNRWTNGASDLFIVNLREQDVADVEIRRWTALYDYHQYHLDARLFSGQILTQ